MKKTLHTPARRRLVLGREVIVELTPPQLSQLVGGIRGSGAGCKTTVSDGGCDTACCVGSGG